MYSNASFLTNNSSSGPGQDGMNSTMVSQYSTGVPEGVTANERSNQGHYTRPDQPTAVNTNTAEESIADMTAAFHMQQLMQRYAIEVTELQYSNRQS